jgi:hypothetical protein
MIRISVAIPDMIGGFSRDRANLGAFEVTLGAGEDRRVVLDATGRRWAAGKCD